MQETLNQYWKKIGKPGSFKQFCELYNQGKHTDQPVGNFKNLDGAQPQTLIEVGDPATPAPPPVILVKSNNDNTHKVLLTALGIMVGFVAVLAIRKMDQHG